ncbi:MAG: hypothetical protein AB7F40_12235 [Victivallaceae bacterium]
MPIDLAKLAKDLLFAVNDLPIAVRIGDKALTGTPAELSQDAIFGEYGYGSTYTTSIIVKTADVLEIRGGDLVVVDEIDHWVIGTRLSADGLSTRIDLQRGHTA